MLRVVYVGRTPSYSLIVLPHEMLVTVLFSVIAIYPVYVYLSSWRGVRLFPFVLLAFLFPVYVLHQRCMTYVHLSISSKIISNLNEMSTFRTTLASSCAVWGWQAYVNY
jgi:hypothetical protein